MKPIHTVKTREEKQTQNKYFFWWKREMKGWIKNRLLKLGKPELAKQLLAYPKTSNNLSSKAEMDAAAAQQMPKRKSNKKSKYKSKLQDEPKKKRRFKKKKGWA